MSPGARPLRLLVLTLAVATFLSACAAIPTTGPVVAGRKVSADPREGVFQVLPDGPVAGASAEGIVTGFLRAAAGFGDDHQVARSFLTPQRRLSWQPEASVAVYPNESSLQLKTVRGHATSASSLRSAGGPDGSAANGWTPPETATVTVRTPIDARIDADGRYRLADPGETVTTTFDLIKYDGQWRISSLSDGILVTAADFDLTFRPFPVYFTDVAGHYLVPDVHWFAVSRDEPGSPELPTVLVRVLLEGPPAWMKGAVTTGAPAGTVMGLSAVVVSGDVATVDLNDRVRSASTRQRQLLLSQLQATLRQLSTIGAVQITVRRLAFDVPAGSSDSSDPSDPSLQPTVDPVVDGRPVVIDSKGQLARLSGHTLKPVKGVTGLAVPGANRPAVSSDGSSAYAVLNGDRSKLLLQLPGTKAVTLVKGDTLSAPSFDPQGWVWTSPAANSGWVYAASLDSDIVKVRAPWLKHMQVVGLRLSRDGSRAVVAVRYRGQAHLFLTGVVRGTDGQARPRLLTQPIGLIPDLQTVKDVAWVDEDQVVVLGRRSSDRDERPWVVQIGGTITPATVVSGAESIAAGNGESSLMAGTPNGIQVRSGALWVKVSSARWPAFPG